MNACLFSVAVASSRMLKAMGQDVIGGDVGLINQPQQWDDCVNYIIVAPTVEHAERAFVGWFTAPREDASITREIKQMVISQLIDSLLGEMGDSPLDWPAICRRADACLEAQNDYFEQGNWVDANTAMPDGQLPASIEALQAALAPDVAEGLNWSAEKRFFFIVSALKPQGAPPPAESGFSIFEETPEEGAGDQPTLPELAEREATALIEARNAVVAVWLWKRFAATTTLAHDRVQIIPWCGAFGFDTPESDGASAS